MGYGHGHVSLRPACLGHQRGERETVLLLSRGSPIIAFVVAGARTRGERKTTQCSVRPLFVVAIACAVLVGCGSTQWSSLTVAAGYQPPKRLNVTVLAISERDDWKEAVETFTTTLRHELKSKGIDANFASTAPGGPGAELKVTEWDTPPSFVWSGNREKAHITIVVSVTNADGGSSLDGEVRGFVVHASGIGGLFEGDVLDAPRAAARSIADVIATGKVVQESEQ